MRLFLNGAQEGSATNSNSISTGSSYGISVGRWTEVDTNYIVGYVSNFRVVKGTAVYTSAFTPPVGPLQAITNTSLLTCAYPTFRDGSTNNFTITVNGNTAVSVQNPFPLTQLPNPALGNQGNGVYTMSQYQALRSQNLWPAIDPYFDYVTLMLHGNGTNGAQNNTFLDSSTNNFTITRNGNTTQGTFTPYGSNWSNYFDGSGDYLSIPSSAGLRFDGQFCVEGWVNFNAFNTQNFLISQFTAAGEAGWLIRYTGTALRLYAQNGAVTIDRTWSPSRGVWYHFAITRDSSNDIRFFIDGTQLGATATGVSTTMSSTNTAYIGGHPDIANDTNAYLSNMRVVKGSAVYTSNFTPSTAPLTAITNTSLLTCQSNRFIDNSTNAFTITRNGDVSVQRFSPFAPTAPYAAGTDGGSGYFDGSGDYLSAPSNAALALPGDFTFECWVNPSNVSGDKAIYSTATSGGLYVYLTGSSVVVRVYAVTTLITAGTIVAGQWSHIAVTRSGTTVTLYVNGTSVGTATSSQSFAQATTYIGSEDGATFYYAGYISNLRLVKGSVVYTSAFTPPTAPLTAITNTSLLTNFTNAGIIDNAEMNNLETVGNAQISTAQSKFGGASLSIPGSGARLVCANTPNFAFGTGNFTLEFWINFSSISSYQTIYSYGYTTSGDLLIQTGNGNGRMIVYVNGSAVITESGTASTGTWIHYALVRNGTTLTLYRDGTSSGSATNSTDINTTEIIGIGANPLGYGGGSPGDAPFNGYIDDLRITKGYARYTSSFTPQRSQWQDQ
jgi:hypothetical protein